jgi:excisionase family DNA binding protein
MSVEKIDSRFPRELLDLDGAAQYLGTTSRHMRRMVSERRVPFTKLGPGRSARLRFDTVRLDAWIEEHSFYPERDA